MIYEKRSAVSLFLCRQGWICLLLIFAGVSLGFLANKDFETNSHLSSAGVETVGSITNKTRSARKNGSSSYSVSYSFSTPNDPYARGIQEVSSEYYGKIEEGDLVPVRYVPADPTINEAEFGSPVVHELLGILSSAGLVLGGLGGGIYLMRRAYGDVWLREHGAVIQARVTAHQIENKERTGPQKGQALWQDQSGKEGRSLTHPLPQLPELGSAITVYTHREGKFRSVWEGDVGSR